MVGAKACSKCLERKPVTEFNKRSKSPDGLQYKCRVCMLAEKRAWNAANKEHIRQYSAERSPIYRAKNKESIAEKKREYHKKNAERIRAKVLKWQKDNKERVNAKNSEWAKANPLQGYVKAARRVAARRSALVGWADSDAISVIYGMARDLTRETGIPHEVDHIVPLQSDLVCGLHCEANLQILTRSENASKGNKHWPDMP